MIEKAHLRLAGDSTIGLHFKVAELLGDFRYGHRDGDFSRPGRRRNDI